MKAEGAGKTGLLLCVSAPWPLGVLVHLMRSAGGIDYEESTKHVVVREVGGVPIPFASPRLLWRMKAVTHREKDAGDLFFLRQWFAERGEEPPKV